VQLEIPQKRGRSDSPPSGKELVLAGRKRKRTRGSGSNGGTHRSRARAGVALSESTTGTARLARLQKRSHTKGQVVQAAYSIVREGSATTTGWQGAPPPKYVQEQMLKQYESGQIKGLLASFYLVRYTR
jgi:hypothetical protein